MKQHFLSILVRVKDEPFINEFVQYYLKEGVDFIYIWDDNSTLKYSDYIYKNENVQVYLKNNYQHPQNLYEKIRFDTEWLAFIDADEFITTKKNNKKTLRDELQTTFKDVQCVKIPWVMFSCNNRKKDPKSLTKELLWRWDHDKKHPHPNNFFKGRCRYTSIDCKSIFKTSRFKFLNKDSDHYPSGTIGNIRIVNSINKKKTKLNPFYYHLREKDIKNGYLVCFHYRLISQESCQRKIETNKYYKNFKIEDLMLCDYCEIYDETLKNYL
ncbi:MAG: hypothetical protein CMF62_01960 [Magnetococcales bacterium]|nr:hypothetical protein [Magnetococcales bacterium]|tara:strand:- start:127462 stop:128268 length:807 start_codon:yes stop_codon:yes gene_type:complete